MTSRAAARLGLALLVGTLVACGGQSTDPRCAAQQALRDAIRAVDLAEAAEDSGDPAAVRRQVDEAGRLVRLARSRLGAAQSTAGGDGAARRMLEAANYLAFIVEDFAASGEVDGALAQFAARELNAAGSGVGGTPLNC